MKTRRLLAPIPASSSEPTLPSLATVLVSTFALAALLEVSPLWAWPDESARTTQPARSIQFHRTANFAIEHSLSEEWAIELGDHLEHLAQQFPAEAISLGAVAPPFEAGTKALRWRCLTAPGTDSGQHRTMLRASYSARRHEVSLTWTTDVRRSAMPADAGFFPDSPNTSLERSPSLMLRISHELAHQLSFDTGLQTRGVMYPVWLAEGLAANFESSGTELRYLGPNLAREDRLAGIARRGEMLSVSRLAVITDAHGLSREARINLYAQAWGFYRFLAETRNEQLRSHLQLLAGLAPGPRSDQALRRELVVSFGAIADVERAWLRWVAERTSRVDG